MLAIVVIKNRELGLMDADLGAGRLLYGYIIQDTNRGWGVEDSYSYSCYLTLTRCCFLQNDPRHRVDFYLT